MTSAPGRLCSPPQPDSRAGLMAVTRRHGHGEARCPRFAPLFWALTWAVLYLLPSGLRTPPSSPTADLSAPCPPSALVPLALNFGNRVASFTHGTQGRTSW